MIPRAFLGLRVPASLQPVLTGLGDGIVRKLENRKPRQVHVDDLHITVAYLGDRQQDELGSLAASLEAALRGSEALEFEVRGVAWLPNSRCCRVAAADVVLVRGIATYDRACEAIGAWDGLVRRPPHWRPHVSLVRLGISGRTPVRLSIDLKGPVRFECTGLELMAALDPPPGPRYRTLASFALSR